MTFYFDNAWVYSSGYVNNKTWTAENPHNFIEIL